MDHFPDTCAKFQFLEHHFSHICQRYCFAEIRTPIIEHADLFHRLGQETDIVHKEMFYLKNNSEVLRPENTASVMRALSANTGLKPSNRFYYSGPMFRREHPQRGRYRQFQQFGVEAVGLQEKNVESDIEVIALAVQCLKKVGLLQNTTLLLNSLGDEESRKSYSKTLANYFNPQQHLLSPISQARLSRGAVLRILDSKDPADIQIVAQAPNILQSLKPSCQQRFELLQEGLTNLGIKYELSPVLVRGLDYYCHTIFEFVDADHAGRQNTVLAGGRYDGFLNVLNIPTPAIGWAAGMDRLTLMLQDAQRLPEPPLIHIIAMSAPCLPMALRIAADLRDQLALRVKVQQGSIREQLGSASAAGAQMCAIIGEDEISSQIVGVKNMASRGQTKVAVGELVNFFRAALKLAPQEGTTA